MIDSRLRWYIEHRIEYLKNKQVHHKHRLEAENLDYDVLREFMENKGRLKELENLRT